MNGPEQKACIFAALVVLCYAIYKVGDPTADGYVLSAVVGTLCTIGGYVYARSKLKV